MKTMVKTTVLILSFLFFMGATPNRYEQKLEIEPKSEDALIREMYVGTCSKLPQYCGLIIKYGLQYGVEVDFIAAIMIHESKGNRFAVNYNKTKSGKQRYCKDGKTPSIDYGLMQLNSCYFLVGASLVKKFDPETNIKTAVQHISYLNQKGKIIVERVLAAYNTGSYKKINIAYVRVVMKHYKKIKMINKENAILVASMERM